MSNNKENLTADEELDILLAKEEFERDEDRAYERDNTISYIHENLPELYEEIMYRIERLEDGYFN